MKRDYQEPTLRVDRLLIKDIVTASPASYNEEFEDHYKEDNWND